MSMKQNINRSNKMKKSLLLAIMLIALPASAAEPLVLQPLNTVLSTSPSSTPGAYTVQEDAPNVTVTENNVVYEAEYIPNAQNLDGNMVPQNAAAKGEPIPQKRTKLINIRTKQRSQGNDYWNPGGKGTKAYF